MEKATKTETFRDEDLYQVIEDLIDRNIYNCGNKERRDYKNARLQMNEYINRFFQRGLDAFWNESMIYDFIAIDNFPPQQLIVQTGYLEPLEIEFFEKDGITVFEGNADFGSRLKIPIPLFRKILTSDCMFQEVEIFILNLHLMPMRIAGEVTEEIKDMFPFVGLKKGVCDQNKN